MSVSDLDILRSAQILLNEYGSSALKEAVNRVKVARKEKDEAKEAVWVRIAQAVTVLYRTKQEDDQLN